MLGLMMDYQLTLDRILEHANRMYPRKQISTMQLDGSMHRYTYADMYKRVKRLSKALVKLGVQPGDRVATFAWNHYQHMELYYAIPGAGASLPHPQHSSLSRPISLHCGSCRRPYRLHRRHLAAAIRTYRPPDYVRQTLRAHQRYPRHKNQLAQRSLLRRPNRRL